MSMQALVRTLDQHEPVTNRNPWPKPSHITCLQVAGLQEHATAPGSALRQHNVMGIYNGSATFIVHESKQFLQI